MGESSVLVNLQGMWHERVQRRLQKRIVRHLGYTSFKVTGTLSCLEDLTEINFDTFEGLPLGFVYRKCPSKNQRHLMYGVMSQNLFKYHII